MSQYPSVSRMKREFGITDNIFDTSFISPDGQLIKTGGSHRFMLRYTDGRSEVVKGVARGIRDFSEIEIRQFLKDTGTIRVSTGNDFNLHLDFSSKITNSQLRQISKMFKESDYIFVDFTVPHQLDVIKGGKLTSMAEFKRVYEKAKKF